MHDGDPMYRVKADTAMACCRNRRDRGRSNMPNCRWLTLTRTTVYRRRGQYNRNEDVYRMQMPGVTPKTAAWPDDDYRPDRVIEPRSLWPSQCVMSTGYRGRPRMKPHDSLEDNARLLVRSGCLRSASARRLNLFQMTRPALLIVTQLWQVPGRQNLSGGMGMAVDDRDSTLAGKIRIDGEDTPDATVDRWCRFLNLVNTYYRGR